MLFNVIHEPYGTHNSIHDVNIVDFIVYHVRQNLWDPIASMPPRSQNWEEPGFSTETVTVLTEKNWGENDRKWKMGHYQWDSLSAKNEIK